MNLSTKAFAIALTTLIHSGCSFSMDRSLPELAKEEILHDVFRVKTPPLPDPEKDQIDHLKYLFIAGEPLCYTDHEKIRVSERGSLAGLLLLKKTIGNQKLSPTEEAQVRSWQNSIGKKYSK